MKRQTRTPWPRVPPGLVAQVLAGHSALGLAMGALIYLICLTGTLDVFVADLRAWEQPTPVAAAQPTAAAFDQAMAGALRAGGGAGKVGSIYVMGPRMNAGSLTAAVYGAGLDETYLARPNGGLGALRRTPWTDFLDKTHMYLGLPTTPGLIAVGVIGAALLSLLLSGVLSHPRIFRDAFTLRLGGGKRLQEADLHNRLSVWGLPFHLAVTLTGTFFGLANIMVLAVATAGYGGDTGRAYAPLLGPTVRPDTRPAPLPPVAVLLARLPSGITLDRVNYVGVNAPGTRGQSLTVEVSAPGRLTRGERYVFDGSGRLLGPSGYVSGSFGRQAYAAAAGLHFGSFGGAPIRVIYGILGAALCAITASGVSIWLARRRDRSRPCPRLERAWLAVIWGVPLALAVAAILSTVSGAPPLVVFWASLALLVAAALFAGPGLPLARVLRLAVSVALLVLVGANLAGGMLPTPGQIAVDGVLVVIAAGLLAHLAGSRRAWIARRHSLQ